MVSTNIVLGRDRLLFNLRRNKIPGLDGIRGIAALSVVGFHDRFIASHDQTGGIFPGRFAVQIFFVISGMLITWLLLQEEQRDGRVDRGRFYWRRAFRLFPALITLLLWHKLAHFPQVTRGEMIATVLYIGNYWGFFHTNLGGLGQTWSLAVEEHFYLIWPHVFLWVRNRRTLLKGCFAAICIQLAWRMILGFHGHFVYAEIATETASCAAVVGCALALLLWYHPHRLPRLFLAPILTPVSIGAIVALAQLPRNAQLFWGVPLGIPFAAILVLQAVTYEWRLLENPIARYFGRISYGIYLWGMVAIAIVERLGHDWMHLPVFAVAIALASISYFLIEQPIQSMGRRWSAASAPNSVTAQAY